MSSEKAMSRENLVEAKNRNKSADNRMLYPTATNFDDLFYEAAPSTDEQPAGWEKYWVFDDSEIGDGSLACALIGPFCKVVGGINLWVRLREHLTKTLKEKMFGVPGDELYFDISHKGSIAVVAVRHHKIVGRKILAKIKWESVPHQ